MKIGVLTSAYPEFEDDPHGIFVHRLMREITKKGYDVKVLAPYAGGKTNYILDGVEVERFNYFYPKKFQRLCGRSGMIDNFKEGFLVKIQIISFLIFNLIYSMLKLRDSDIIHLHWAIPNGLGALALKYIYHIPFITTVYGEEIYLSKKYLLGKVIRFLLNHSITVVSISEETFKNSLDLGVSNKKIQIIPYGVDTDFFKPLNLKKKDDTFQIISVGYLIERKGFQYLIKAMELVLNKHENVKLKIVGSGPLETKLKTLINGLNLNKKVEIIKNVSDEELLRLYNSSDLFVLPSIVDSQGNTEGLGIVLLEAMACRLPVIGSNVGGIPDIIKNNQTGLLIPEKNVNRLSRSILDLIKKKKLRNKIAFNGYDSVREKFSWEMIAEEYTKIYKSIKST